MCLETKPKTSRMQIKSSYICLKNLRFRAFHGVLEQERIVGNDYVLSLRIGFPLNKAVESDRIDDTLNYANVYHLVEREMQMPSKLLEHVAGRIARRLAATCPDITSIDIMLTKVNPPMGADCDGAEVEIHFEK